MKLTEKDKAALRGELSPQAWEAHGMALFKKGLVSLDPLLAGLPQTFQLTNLGQAEAIRLRKPSTA